MWDVKTGAFVREVGEGSECVWKVGFGGGGGGGASASGGYGYGGGGGSGYGGGGGHGGGTGRDVLAVMCKRSGKTAVEIWSLRQNAGVGGSGVKRQRVGS